MKQNSGIHWILLKTKATLFLKLILYVSKIEKAYLGEVSKINAAGWAYSSTVVEIKGRRWREKYLAGMT